MAFSRLVASGQRASATVYHRLRTLNLTRNAFANKIYTANAGQATWAVRLYQFMNSTNLLSEKLKMELCACNLDSNPCRRTLNLFTVRRLSTLQTRRFF